MTDSHANPDQVPNRCAVCGGDVFLNLVQTAGFALCPQCGRAFRLISEYFEVSEAKVTLTTLFVEDLGADSLDVIELVMELEEEFGITIPEDQTERIKTVGEAIAVVESLAAQRR